MSSEDVWYFLRGEEQVGPFSKDIIRQIHQGGQLPLETLVWRNGMAGWESAGSVAELELAKVTDPAPPPPHASSSDAPAPAKAAAPIAPALGQGIAAAPSSESPKLKLRFSTSPAEPAATPASPSTSAKPTNQPIPTSQPAPTSPAPAASSGHGLKVKEVERKELRPEDSPNVIAGQSKLKRKISFLTSSAFIAPLFMMVAGIFFIIYQTEFPNPFGIKWIIAASIIIGALSIGNIRSFDPIFRFIVLYLILPPLVLFWPAIMGNISFTQIPSTHWFFSAFCILYCMTIRIGLRNFIPFGLDKLAILTGLLVLTSIFSIGMGAWKPENWDSFAQEGGNIRIPGRWARLIGQPDWGHESGKVYLQIAKSSTQHAVEKASITRPDVKTGVLNVQLIDGNIFYVKFEFPENEGYDINKVTDKNWPIYFKQETFDEMDNSGSGNLIIDGETIHVTNGTFYLAKRENNVWKGTMIFKIEKANPRAPDKMTGSFVFTVDESPEIVIKSGNN